MGSVMTREQLTDEAYWRATWLSKSQGRHRSLAQAVALLRPLTKHPALHQSKSLRVLEVGCCPGVMLRAIHAVFPTASLNGVDICAEGLIHTRKTLNADGVTAALELGDIATWQPLMPFDATVSFGLLEHFLDPVAILQKMVSCTLRGGVVYATIPQYTTSCCKATIDVLDPDMWNAHHPQLMTTAGLKHAFEAAGLKNTAAGLVGPPLLRTVRSKPGLLPFVVQALARTHNMLTQTLLRDPYCGWSTAVWGIGFVE